MCKHQMSGWCFYSAKFLMLTSLAILQDTKSRKFNYKSWLVESLGSGSILPKFTVKYSIPSIYLTQNEQNYGSEFKLNFY